MQQFDITHFLNGPFGSIIGAVLIFIVALLFAGILSSATRKALAKTSLNQRMSSSTGKAYDLEHIISRVVYWFVLIIGISASLNLLNLNSISLPFANMVNQVMLAIPKGIMALVIFGVGWVLATIARTLLTSKLAQTSLDSKLSSEAEIPPLSHTIGDVVFWLILLLFLPMVLGQLGLTGLLEPVSGMISKILDFIPNLFFAVIIFVVGYTLAKICKNLITSLVSGLNIQELAKKAGINDHTKLASIAGSLVFLVIILLTLIISLDTLKVEVISRPATNMLNQIMQAIPQILVAVAILGVTYYVIRFVANIVSDLLANTAVNELPAKFGLQSAMGEKKLSDFIGSLLIFFTMLFASIEAANRLGFNKVSELITLFIQFGADIILGSIILVIGFWLANMIADVVRRSEQGSQFLANIVRVLIMGLVLAMGLRAMGIADSIVNLAFGLTLGSVAVAFALSFGLGGQAAAARYLKNLQDKMDCETNNKPIHDDKDQPDTSSLSQTSLQVEEVSSQVEPNSQYGTQDDTQVTDEKRDNSTSSSYFNRDDF